MDKQIQESIQKFENKKDFFEAKLKTRQSFREDQEALERRLAKYRLEEKSNGDSEDVDEIKSKDRDQNGEVANKTDSKDENSKPVVVESKDTDHNNSEVVDEIKSKDANCKAVDQNEPKDGSQVTTNGEEHSKLESIVMDIQKEQKQERKRTDSATADKEECEIRVSNDFIIAEGETAKDDVTKDVKSTENSEGLQADSKADKVNGHAVMARDDFDNIESRSATVSNASRNSSKISTNSSKTLQNGHVIGSLTPEPRLKMRGTRLYEKNSRLSASSSDHLDKISLKAGPKSAGHSQTASPHMRRGSEQRVLVPVIPAPELMSLPADGNLQGFSVQQMVSVFRLLHVSEKLIYRLATSNVDGKRFAMFSDKDLETLVGFYMIKTTEKSAENAEQDQTARKVAKCRKRVQADLVLHSPENTTKVAESRIRIVDLQNEAVFTNPSKVVSF